MIDEGDDRLLMSDSLRGVVPELDDEEVEKYRDSYIVVSADLSDGDEFILSGLCVGIAFEPSETKIDIKVPLALGYEVFARLKSGKQTCKCLYLNRGQDVLEYPGPYSVVSPRLTDFDRPTVMCNLGLDLIKM